jgi:hypothetical protein
MSNYAIVRGSVPEVVEKVNELMKEGFAPVGSPVHGIGELFQAMAKIAAQNQATEQASVADLRAVEPMFITPANSCGNCLRYLAECSRGKPGFICKQYLCS